MDSAQKQGPGQRRPGGLPLYGLCSHLLYALHCPYVRAPYPLNPVKLKAPVDPSTDDAYQILETRYGLGLPLALRPKESLVIYTKVNFAGRPIYQIGISFFKMALLISYLRLLQGTNQRIYRIIVYVTIALVFLAHLGCSFSLIFACTPVGHIP